MTSPNTSLRVYRHRSIPAGYGSNFLMQEFVNVEQGALGLIADGLAPYIILPGESGVISQFYPWGDIRRYGAVEGGTVDCTTAYRRAELNVGITGVPVMTPRGVWKVTGQVTVSQNDAAFLFHPGAEVVLTIPNTDNGFIYADQKDRVSVLGGQFSGAYPWLTFIAGGEGHQIVEPKASGGTVPVNGKCGGLYLEDCRDFLIRRARLSGNGNASLDAGADILCNFGATIVEDGTIEECECTSTLTTENILAFNPLRCQFLNNKTSGARVTFSDPGIGGYGTALYRTIGISASQVGKCLIQGGTAEDQAGIGYYTQGVPRTAIDNVTATNCCLTMQEVSLNVAAIVCESEHGAVTNSNVSNSTKAGIIIGGDAHYARIANNDVDTTVREGITIVGDVTDVMISDNRLSNISDLALGCWRFNDYALERCVLQNNSMDTVDQPMFFGASSSDCTMQNNISWNAVDPAYGAKNDGSGAITQGNYCNGSPA